jgi:glycosyltransferase involved in cell wall biosynthesis
LSGREAVEGALRRVLQSALGAAQQFPLIRSAARLVLPPSLRTNVVHLGTPPHEISLKAFEELLATADPMRNDQGGPVVICCGSLAPGGAERQIVNTLCGLAQYGLRDRLIFLAERLTPDRPEHYDFYLPMLQKAGIAAREIRETNEAHDFGPCGAPDAVEAIRRLPLMADVANLYREFVDLKPAVVHAWLDRGSVRAGLAAVLAGVPNIILSGRNLNPSHFFFFAPYLLPAYQALAQQPRVTFINNSEAGALDYAQWIGMPRERLRVVRNGVDFDELVRPSQEAVTTLRASLGAPLGAPLVGGLFRFSPEKRPELWIETAASIAAARADCRFALFGMGPLRNDMATLAEKRGIGDRLAIRDVTPEPLVALAAFDACLLTSGAEGTPNVALEAQWLGIPVIVTAGGGTRESIDLGASGWLVEEPAPDALAKAVLQVLSDPNLKAAAAVRGPAFVTRRFGMDRMLRETLDLYGIKAEFSDRERNAISTDR